MVMMVVVVSRWIANKLRARVIAYACSIDYRYVECSLQHVEAMSTWANKSPGKWLFNKRRRVDCVAQARSIREDLQLHEHFSEHLNQRHSVQLFMLTGLVPRHHDADCISTGLADRRADEHIVHIVTERMYRADIMMHWVHKTYNLVTMLVCV